MFMADVTSRRPSSLDEDYVRVLARDVPKRFALRIRIGAISRWWTMHFLSTCNISIGSSTVMMFRRLFLVSQSTTAAREVVLSAAGRHRDEHEPRGPRPRAFSLQEAARASSKLGIFLVRTRLIAYTDRATLLEHVSPEACQAGQAFQKPTNRISRNSGGRPGQVQG